MKEQYVADLNPRSQSGLHDIRQKTLAGSKYALLIAGLAFVSFILISLVSIVFNIFHLFHTFGAASNFHELEVSPGSMLSLRFIAPCVVVFAVFLVIWLSREPICIIRYLRQIKREEEQRRSVELYIPLNALPVANPANETPQGRENRSQGLDLMLWAQQQQDKHLLLLGPRGSGKTLFLHVYQVSMLRHLWKIIFGQLRIPVFVSMETYNTFLKYELVDFLQMKVPEMHPLRRYLRKMATKGRLLLLCDGINMISANELDALCGHLLGLMDETDNRFIMTCHQIEYLEHPYIQELVTETKGKTALAVLDTLPQTQVEHFIHQYIEQQNNIWSYSADEIFQVINQAHLLSLCTNPSALLLLMQVIDQAGRGEEPALDTRGLLVQAFVNRKIDTELQSEWSNAGLTRDDVLRFLSELAYIMRWTGDQNELKLSLPFEEGSFDYEVLADELLDWLGAQQPQGLFVADQGIHLGLFQDTLHKRKRIRLLQFARSAQFITIHPEGDLSFEQGLIADYFVASYLYVLTKNSEWQTLESLNAAFLSEEAGERWGEPFALWAGLDDIAPFVDRIAQVGQRDQQYAAPALMLILVCLDAKRQPQQDVYLPQEVQQMVVSAAADKNTRRKLARVFDRFAAENGTWVYQTLLPLLATTDVEQLIVLLKNKSVPQLLFVHLERIADNVRDSSRREPLIRILRHFASQKCEDVIRIAAQLSQSAPQRSLQLRKAAIDILGYTQDKRAIKPLLPLLQENQAEIVRVSSSAIARLGPSLALESLIEELHHAGSRASIPILSILEHFLTVQQQEFQLKDVEYAHVLEELIPVLSSNYPIEAQECACELLKKLIQSTTDKTKQRREKIVVLLLEQLESENKALGNHVVELLKELKEFATPYLLSRLQPGLSSIARRRIVDVLSRVRDPRALDALLSLVADEEVFYSVKFALQNYASEYPDCINRLIALVLDDPGKEVSDRAAEILGDIGDAVVDPVINALPGIKDGRTEKLVQVLIKVQDKRAIPVLIDLLTMPQVRNNIELALTLIGGLGEFRDQSVVPPLLTMLASPHTQLINEATDVLSNLGEIAFHQLIDALTPQQKIDRSLLRQALIQMKSPLYQKNFSVDEELFKTFSICDDELAQQMRMIFRERGVSAAQVLIQHIPDHDSQVQNRVLLALYAMNPSDVIPAFVTALRQPSSQLDPVLMSKAARYLTQYDESILALVIASRDPHSDALSTILLEFGAKLLHGDAMLVGLEDVETKERMLSIMKTLAARQPEIMAQIIDLFSLIKDKKQHPLAFAALVDLLADDLAAQQSIRYLIEALEKPGVVDGAADALQRLAGRVETQHEVIDGLIQFLQSGKGRDGAKEALVRLGDKAVYPVGDLIADDDSLVAPTAQEILIRIGPPAFPVIWSALSDTDGRHPGRQDAGRNILCAMPTGMLKDQLITLLSSDNIADIELAVTLLLELIQNEAQRPKSQKIVPALLASIEAKMPEYKKLRILTLLLLWGESNVAESLLQKLSDKSNSQLDEQLAQAFLLLKKEMASKVLQDAMRDTTGTLSPQLYAQLAGILGMIKPDLVGDYARNVAAYGLFEGGNGRMKNQNQLAISLRALGALLVNGSWNIARLRQLRENAETETPQRELFDILLGDLYSPRIQSIIQQKEAEAAQRKAQEQVNRQLDGMLGQANKDLQEANGQLQLAQGKLQQVHGQLAQAEAERDQAKAEAGKWQSAYQQLLLKQQQGPGTGGTSQGSGTPLWH